MTVEDRARRTREILESTSRRAITGHQGYEPTDPPPPPPARPPMPTLADQVVHHSKWVGALKMLAAAVIASGGTFLTTADWFRSRVSAKEAQQICADQVASAVKPFATLPTWQRNVDKRLNKDDQRWDRLDAWHAKQKRPANTTPPSKFGPSAEKHGEVRYDEPEDDQ
jgi:hypothetical protein